MNLLLFPNSGWTAPLINHLWQSTVVVAIAWLLALALRKNHAGGRYWVWFAASVKFLLPFSLLMTAGEGLRSFFAAPIVAKPALANAMEQIAQPFPQIQFFDAGQTPVTAHHGNLLAAVLLTIWICGALIVAFRFGRGSLRVYAAKQAARPLALAADVPVLSSPASIEPGIFGIFRLVLLLPEGILERLTPEQLRAIVAHEMCHVRRRDNLTFAVHMIVEALFWFHPAVWWIGARLIEERERACDEAVLQSGSVPEIYAEGILNVCKFYVESPLECVAGVTGADLKRRVAEIMTGPARLRMTWPKKLLIGAMAVCGVAAPVAFGLIQRIPLRGQVLHADGPPPSFEVASIKPQEGAPPPMPGGPPPIPRDEVLLFVNTRILISMAYDVQGFAKSEIVGGPSWLDDQIYEVHAKINGPLSEAMQQIPNRERRQKIELMEQSLLADRFKLKVHFETRELPEFALVAARDGPRLTPTDPSLPHKDPARVSQGQNEELKITGGTIQNLAQLLQMDRGVDSEVGGRLIVDKTGLTGSYDLTLNWTRDQSTDASASQDGGPSLFSALEEQLGLKLVPTKGPVEVVVIDHVERPSPN